MKAVFKCALGVMLGVSAPLVAQSSSPTSYAAAIRAHYRPLTTIMARDARLPERLARRVSVHMQRAPLPQVLVEIATQARLGLSYGEEVASANATVSLDLDGATAAEALVAAVRGTQWTAMVTASGQVLVVEGPPEATKMQTSTIMGTVIDAKTGEPVLAVTVTVEGTARAAHTDADGKYRIAGVPAGTYEVSARRLGYAKATRSVTVGDADTVQVDFAMEKSPSVLDQVVTTGTVIPTEVKALPSPITVITSDRIEQQHALTMMAIIRQAVPTAVARDAPNVPANTDISVRGASSLNGAGDMKIFVDGVEATAFGNSAVDPTDIGRIEVVRGPQAATLYGADAASGVIQIFTKRGDTSLTRPQLNTRVEMGLSETPYANFEHVLRQQYSGTVYGGAPNISYRFGGGYKRLADYVVENGGTRQSASSVYGGMRFSRGILDADLSGRYYRNSIPQAYNPELSTTGYPAYAKPQYTDGTFTNETYGARVIVSPTQWWRNQVTFGIDRLGIGIVQRQPRYTTPSDSLLRLTDWMLHKLSVGYNTTARGTIGKSLSGSFTLGVDHYVQSVNNVVASRAKATSGAIVTVPVGGLSVSRTSVANTGYFAQLQVAIRDALFLTAGMRAEDNASFGRDYGLATLPRVGVSFVHPVGEATLKLRASYGRALRTPGPNEAAGRESPTSIQLANPDLAPERQQGWDGGMDLILGSKGSLSISGFDQTARDLIAFLTVGTTPVVTSQYQNIGKVSNRGIELEGVINPAPWVTVSMQYGYVRSRIVAVGAAGGQVEPGDPPVNVPSRTAGATLTLTPRIGTTINAGLTYVGGFRAMDWVATLRCFASFSSADCPSSFLSESSTRDFIVKYPGFAKLNVSVTHRFTPRLEAFVTIDNLTNSNAFEADKSTPVVGRTTMVGFDTSF
jgi:outer membrane receptor protein involved in Fe transport